MRIAVVALTKNGAKVALRISKGLENQNIVDMKIDIYIKEGIEVKSDIIEFDSLKDQKIVYFKNPLSSLVLDIFTSYEAIIFVMATGIVVRVIAKLLKNKSKDPAIIVVDELGKNIISLVSGHLGGANEITLKIANSIQGNPVITTATDINNVIAFDIVAKKNNLIIENLENLKYISSQLVNGGIVGLYSDSSINGVLPRNIKKIDLIAQKEYECGVLITNKTNIKIKAEKILFLRPKNLIIGIGCRKGTELANIQAAIIDFMKKKERSLLSVKAIATIDIKKNEEGIKLFCEKNKLELKIIDSESVLKVEEQFTVSSFVKSRVGVGSVAEPCCMLAGNDMSLISKKTIYKGITLALAEEKSEVYL